MAPRTNILNCCLVWTTNCKNLYYLLYKYFYLQWNYKLRFCSCWIHQSLNVLFSSEIQGSLCCQVSNEGTISYSFKKISFTTNILDIKLVKIQVFFLQGRPTITIFNNRFWKVLMHMVHETCDKSCVRKLTTNPLGDHCWSWKAKISVVHFEFNQKLFTCTIRRHTFP